MVAIQKLSIHCNFGTYLKTALRNKFKFVFGVKNNRIRCRLLELEYLTFETAVKTAISMELSEKDANKSDTSSGVHQVSIRTKKKPQESKPLKPSTIQNKLAFKPKQESFNNFTTNANVSGMGKSSGLNLSFV